MKDWQRYQHKDEEYSDELIHQLRRAYGYPEPSWLDRHPIVKGVLVILGILLLLFLALLLF